MNLNGCGACHAQPATGGSSPAVNPQVAFARRQVPSQLGAVDAFIRSNGPGARSALRAQPDGTPDGGVHALFTITGREGAAGCSLQQPDFARELARNNVIFRIPTPVFGAGLIEQIPDAAILANMAANSFDKSALGIRGKPNLVVAGRTITGSTNNNGNDGTIARFGWKAQNSTLLLFSARPTTSRWASPTSSSSGARAGGECQFATVPNDTQNFDAADALTGTTAIQNFANFQRFLAPPRPSSTRRADRLDRARRPSVFSDIGCALCHTPTLRPATPRCRAAQPRREPVLRPAGARHGRRAGRRHQPGRGGAARVPHRAAVGPRAAHLLPARRAHVGPEGGDPAST
jgi:hypothetical protein